jgi:hypothetical protein
MFDRFRQKYPQGSITSSLIQIHNDRYIVSVSIKVDGVILATTLAADENIQIAEAQATTQALQTLSIDEPVTVQQASAHSPTAVGAAFPELPLTRLPAVEPSQLPSRASADIEPVAVEIVELKPQVEVSLPTPMLPSNDHEPIHTPDAIEATNEPLAKTAKSKKAAVVSEDANTYDPPAEPPLSVTDMIPLINMELKRLTWSREKGRDCIIELYNNRSSSLLSDEELLGLLRYLQTQPTPDG